MNLTQLYELQDRVKAHINYKGEDKSEKMLLAFLVELGECANEWRRFKYWSKDQEPRVEKLLEEYVDGLHFVLEMGLDMGIRLEEVEPYSGVTDDPTLHFISIFDIAANFATTLLGYRSESFRRYLILVKKYLTLGTVLGFTEEEIKAAYIEKNNINHQRQEEGY